MRTSTPTIAARHAHSMGFTLIELMIAMTISLMLLVALVSVFVNTSRSHAEMVKSNGVIENGRIAMQILEDDIVHSGFWGGHLPTFDDLTNSIAPGDTPSAIPNPCQAYATWGSDYTANVIGIAVESTETLPAGAGCETPVAPLAKRAGTDALIVRHADTCAAGDANCDADVAGRLYFQPSFCAAEKNAGTVVLATSNSITLGANASSTTNAYAGVSVRLVAGTGAGQVRTINTYDGTSRVATISTAWTLIPDSTTTYAFDYAFGTTVFPLHRRECVGTGVPATLPVTAGALAEKRRYISNIYYITDVTHPERTNEVIPTLVRSRFDTFSGTPGQLAPETLIAGIESLRIELGIDDVSDAGTAVNLSTPIDWDPTKTSPKNRGDGVPDRFIRCTTALPCTAADLTNVVAVKLYVLARSLDRSTDYTDTKSYCLGEPAADGSCPTENKIAAANDNYKRHVFTSSVRLTNISGRRETP